eukprot:2002108-Lingulodinium_polyedra.AAC.1
MDMTHDRVLQEVLRWIRSGETWCVWLGTPCTRWSRSRTTGHAGSKTDRSGLAAAKATITIIEACVASGAYYVLENPDSSGLFEWAPLAR